MTITPFQIYIVSKLDAIIIMCGLSLAVCILAALFIFVVHDDYDISTADAIKYAKRISLVGLFFLLCCVMCPTTKQAIAMMTLPKIVNSKLVQSDIPDALVELCKKALKDGKNSGDK